MLKARKLCQFVLEEEELLDALKRDRQTSIREISDQDLFRACGRSDLFTSLQTIRKEIKSRGYDLFEYDLLVGGVLPETIGILAEYDKTPEAMHYFVEACERSGLPYRYVGDQTEHISID